MKVLMVASEAYPFSKTGGLADVIYALSSKLVKRRQSITITLPLYRETFKKLNFDELELFASFEVKMSWRHQRCDVYKYVYQKITYLFIDNEHYFMRDKLYGYDDDIERFSFFDLAIKELLIKKNLRFDIIHLHDWQTGMIPLLLKEYEAPKKHFKYVFTIHNLAYQGIASREDLGNYLNLDDYYYDGGLTRFHNHVNFLKTALMTVDKITTVSMSYAREILSGHYAYGMDTILKLREKDFVGILNGIDNIIYDPKNDPLIPYHYGLSDFKKGKQTCKEALLKKVNLKDSRRPLFAIVTRLTFQKGIDLINDVIPTLIKNGANIIVLGTGEYNLENQLSFFSQHDSDHIHVHIGFDEEEAHLIYAGSDFFLMPSLYEPCGIGQMLALRYGSLPIVRPVGGLYDTVNGYTGLNLNDANGIYIYHHSSSAFKSAIGTALCLYNHKKSLSSLIKNALKSKNDWSKPADNYMELYRKLLDK